MPAINPGLVKWSAALLNTYYVTAPSSGREAFMTSDGHRFLSRK